MWFISERVNELEKEIKSVKVFEKRVSGGFTLTRARHYTHVPKPRKNIEQ